MKKIGNFAPALSDLREFMFVQETGNKVVFYKVKIEDYDN